MKKVLFDTNILVSAILDNRSTTYQAYSKGVEPPYQGLICEQVFEELRRVFNRKFPNKIAALERFIATSLSILEVIPVPPSKHPDEDLVRDVDDRPILRAAIKADAAILISGDKDFLESGLTSPKIVTAAEFLKMP